MEGDMAPIADFAKLAEAEDAWLLMDEAHATGVHGPQGRGLTAALEGQDNAISLHTCGKGLGVEGALVCCPDVIKRYLVRSEEHTSELQSLMRISSAVFCLKKNNKTPHQRLENKH